MAELLFKPPNLPTPQHGLSPRHARFASIGREACHAELNQRPTTPSATISRHRLPGPARLRCAINLPSPSAEPRPALLFATQGLHGLWGLGSAVQCLLDKSLMRRNFAEAQPLAQAGAAPVAQQIETAHLPSLSGILGWFSRAERLFEPCRAAFAGQNRATFGFTSLTAARRTGPPSVLAGEGPGIRTLFALGAHLRRRPPTWRIPGHGNICQLFSGANSAAALL